MGLPDSDGERCFNCVANGCTVGGLQFEPAAVGDGIATFHCKCGCHTLDMRATDWLARWPADSGTKVYVRQLVEDLWSALQAERERTTAAEGGEVHQ